MPQYPGYRIGNQGTIIGHYGRPLKPFLRKEYYAVNICLYGHAKSTNIHKLVGLAWIPNPENKPCIDHINRDKLNNRVENLRWATYSENNQNMPMNSRNKTGIIGLFYHQIDNRWVAGKTIDGVKQVKSFKERSDAEIYLQQILGNL